MTLRVIHTMWHILGFRFLMWLRRRGIFKTFEEGGVLYFWWENNE